jgi:hypothetical protein
LKTQTGNLKFLVCEETSLKFHNVDGIFKIIKSQDSLTLSKGVLFLEAVKDWFKEVFPTPGIMIFHFIFSEKSRGFAYQVKVLEDAGIIDFMKDVFLDLLYFGFQGPSNGHFLLAADQDRSFVKETTHLSFFVVGINFVLRDDFDFFIVELCPFFIDLKQDFVMTGIGSGPFMNHHSPQMIEFNFVLLVQFVDFVFQK